MLRAQFSVGDTDRILVSISEAAAMLSIAPKTLYNQVSAGACPLKTIKVGGRRLVFLQDLHNLTQDRPLLTPGRKARRSNQPG